MPTTFKKDGTIRNFTTPFDVQTTRPLDIRLVVDSVEDLKSIEAPYLGMVVTIAGTSELYILTSAPEFANDLDNWKLVTGSGSGDSTGLGKYSIPVMTPDMVQEAINDTDVDFDESETPHVLIEYDYHETDNANPNIFYEGIIQDMYRSIVTLQAEVTRLRNAFDYGIYSYKDRRTAKSEQIGEPWLADVEAEEPLWAIDPGIGLELVSDNSNFNTTLDGNHGFKKSQGGSIVVNQEDGWLTFDDCIGYFYDGMEANVEDTKLTLAHLNDSKLMVYLVTSSPKIKMHLKSLDNTSITREVNFEPLLNGRTTSKYGFCVVISRKDKTTQSGFNYVYFSVIDYERDAKLCEGYWDGTALTQHRSEVNERYTIYSLEFDRLTLYRIKFYTKYEDFTEEVIPSIPDEKTMYEVAHIAIRAVKDTDQLNEVANRLVDNELIWNKDKGTLHIKSGGKIYKIGSNSSDPDDDEHNKDKYMTDKQLIETLEKMGIIVNGVVYEKDENGDDVVKSFNSISMNPIADITFIHQDTGNKYRCKDRHRNQPRHQCDRTVEYISGYCLGKQEAQKRTQQASECAEDDALTHKLSDDAAVACAKRLAKANLLTPLCDDCRHGGRHADHRQCQYDDCNEKDQ